MTRIGSLFSGFGGLDLAVAQATGGTVAWHVENNPDAARILAHHWPDVPNHDDITQIDWAAVEPIDVLTGGFPCQDVSSAGKRAGLTDGTRSGLWSHMAAAVDVLHPRLVIIENVRGLLSATATRPDTARNVGCDLCDMADDRPALRALGAVLGDLATLRYDARWCGVPASDVGAPHSRFRIFIAAQPAADTDGARYRVRAGPGMADELRFADGTRRRGAAAADTGRQRHGRRADIGPLGRMDGGDEDSPRQRQRARTVPVDRSAATATHPDGDGRESIGREHTIRRDTDRRGSANIAWGAYEPAIRRWETILGRPAPNPTEPTGTDGGPRLSAAFVEHMMGLPAGWVTDVPEVNRNAQLRALGNGVVPQQAAEALRRLGVTP